MIKKYTLNSIDQIEFRLFIEIAQAKMHINIMIIMRCEPRNFYGGT